MKFKEIDINEVIRLNNEGWNQKEIANQFGCVYQDIQRLLKHNKIKLTWIRKCKIEKDDNFFSIIDTEIKAYLLGFIYADGHLTKQGYRLSICIQEDDIYIVNLFKDFIAKDSLIKRNHNKKGAVNRKPQVVIRIASKELVQDLMSYGLCNRKTYKELDFPNIPENMYPHFIRGYFDGDGCIGTCNKHKRVDICINWISFGTSLMKILHNIDIKKISFKETVGKEVSWFTLRILAGSSVEKFRDYIYKDSNFFLKRKKDKFYDGNTEVIIDSKESITP